tara:strand:+ start:3804 stop:4016 length:213 start_codon:yes stop_codon:yes gene_type:complete
MPGSFYPIWVINDKNNPEKKEVFMNKKKTTIDMNNVDTYLQKCIEDSDYKKNHMECVYLKNYIKRILFNE